MDATTVRARLRAEGIDCTVHRDGTLTAGLLKPREQSWAIFLLHRVESIPGAVVWLSKERPAADPYFMHTEVRFRLSPEPVTDAPSAPSGAPLRRATSAVTADGGSGHSLAPVCREDVTAGRDRHFEPPRGTRPALIHSVTAQLLHTEGPSHEVATGDRAVAPPAHMCVSPGWRPGSSEGPGRIPPGSAMVGRAEQGRAA